MIHHEMVLAIEQQAACPYGRKAIVGDTRCVNCIFNVMINTKCLGSEELVKQHMERLGLYY